MVRQLGLDLHAVAALVAATPVREVQSRAVPQRLDGQTPPVALDRPRVDLEDHLYHLFHDLWNRRRFDVMAAHYAPGVVLHTAGGRTTTGISNIRALHLALLAALPDASLTVAHVCWSDEVDGVVAAVRWELAGTSAAGGWFGKWPAGVPVFVPGMTHCRFDAAGRIVEEWTVFDEIAVAAQAYRGALR